MCLPYRIHRAKIKLFTDILNFLFTLHLLYYIIIIHIYYIKDWDEFFMDLGDYLLEYKMDHNIGNQKLADTLTISKITLLKILNKQAVPNVRTCMKISKATGVSFKDIIKLRDNYSEQCSYKPMK